MSDLPNDIAGQIDLDEEEGGKVFTVGGVFHAQEDVDQDDNDTRMDSISLDVADTTKALRILSSQSSRCNVFSVSVISRLNVIKFYAFGVLSAILTIACYSIYTCQPNFVMANKGYCVDMGKNIYDSHHSLNSAMIGLVVIPFLSQIITMYATCGVYVYASRTAEAKDEPNTQSLAVCHSWAQATCLMGDPANVFAATSIFAAIRNNGTIKFRTHPGAINLALCLIEDFVSFYYCAFFMPVYTHPVVVIKFLLSLWHFVCSVRLLYFLFLKYGRFTYFIPHNISEGFFYRIIKQFDWDASVDFFELLAEKEWLSQQEMTLSY